MLFYQNTALHAAGVHDKRQLGTAAPMRCGPEALSCLQASGGYGGGCVWAHGGRGAGSSTLASTDFCVAVLQLPPPLLTHTHTHQPMLIVHPASVSLSCSTHAHSTCPCATPIPKSWFTAVQLCPAMVVGISGLILCPFLGHVSGRFLAIGGEMGGGG